MKKITAVLICFAVVVTMAAGLAYAEGYDGEYSDYPVVLVPGYTSSYFYDGDTGEHVWGLDMGGIGNMVLENIAEVGAGLGAMTLGNANKIADTVGNAVLELCGKMACNPDGTSKYNLQQYYSSAADSRLTALMEKYPDGSMRTEHEICEVIASHVGFDNIFQFTCDFRMGQEYCAGMLDAFVEDVCALTGKDRVNIYAVSHGGQTTSSYIALYGNKGRINNAVLTIPAIGGASFAADPILNQVHLDEECIARFVEFGNDIELDADWLFKAQKLGFLDDVVEKLLPYIMEVVGNWGSIWDFIPAADYEQAKAFRLDPVTNAGIIEKSDRYHYEIAPLVAQEMRACNENGSHISIVAGTGQEPVTGYQADSDGVIPTVCSSGATVAPFGERFPDGYTQVNDCGGKYKVSPSMTVDASTAYLPDNTWFIEGLFHGMTFREPFARKLTMLLLLTDRIKDVYTDKAFPQFMYSAGAADTVYAEFEDEIPGYFNKNASALKIRNTSIKGKITVTGVTVDGTASFRVSLPLKRTLGPGEELIAKVSSVSGQGRQVANVTVNYLIDTATPAGYRQLAFTLLDENETASETDASLPRDLTALGSLVGETGIKILRYLGLYEFLSMIYAQFAYIFRAAGSIFG